MQTIKQHYNNVNKSSFENTNPVELPEDIWNKIELCKPEFPINLNTLSFIIKDVVLKYVKTEIEYNTIRIDWFSIEDDIIYSKNFARFKTNQDSFVI